MEIKNSIFLILEKNMTKFHINTKSIILKNEIKERHNILQSHMEK